MEGKELSEANIEEAKQIICGEINPIDDVRSTAEYRMEMSKVLLGRVIKLALKVGG